jgi:hypothetical protein
MPHFSTISDPNVELISFKFFIHFVYEETTVQYKILPTKNALNEQVNLSANTPIIQGC